MFVFIKKQYPENFAFLILRILELLFLNVCKQTYHITYVRISQKVKFSIYYFHLKTQILADFQICISVPLKELGKNRQNISEALSIHYIKK